MDKQNHLRGSDLFTEEEAREIAAAAAAKKQADPSALQRAIGRIRSVQGAKTGRSGWDKLFERYPARRGF